MLPQRPDAALLRADGVFKFFIQPKQVCIAALLECLECLRSVIDESP